MPAEIVNAVFCADYWSTFEITSAKSGKVYLVSWGGAESPVFCREKTTGEQCPANKYNHSCSHATATFEKGCFWNPQWYEGGTRELRPVQIHTNTADNETTCPGCGGPVVPVRIAV